MAAPAANPLGGAMRQLALLPVLWSSGKIDFTNENNKFMLQCWFCFVILSIIAVIEFTTSKVKKLNDSSRVADPGTVMTLSDDQKAADGSCSVCTYDVAKLKEARNQVLMSAGMSFFIHTMWGYTQPLVVMSVMQPMQLWDNKAIQVHLFGKSGPGFERPWAAPTAGNPLAEWAERKKAEAEQAQNESKKRK